jgi:predicted acyltransferase
VEIKSATSFFIFFLVVVGTQFGFQQSKMESQKTFCVNIFDRWLNIPTRLKAVAVATRMEHRGE